MPVTTTKRTTVDVMFGLSPCNYNCLTAGGTYKSCTCACNGKLHGAWRGIAYEISKRKI